MAFDDGQREPTFGDQLLSGHVSRDLGRKIHDIAVRRRPIRVLQISEEIGVRCSVIRGLKYGYRIRQSDYDKIRAWLDKQPLDLK